MEKVGDMRAVDGDKREEAYIRFDRTAQLLF